jgi:putative transposase
MPYRSNRGSGGHIYHVTNRAALGQVLFDSPASYLLFLITLQQALERTPTMRLLAYCLMPNHFHLVLAPGRDEDLTEFMHWLTGTHAKRLRHATKTVGRGAVYQGPYRADRVDNESGLYRLFRYVERNPVRAHLAERAECWPWSSATLNPVTRIPLTPWPVPRPTDWLAILAEDERPFETETVRLRIVHRRPMLRPDRTTEDAQPPRPSWFHSPRGAEPSGPDDPSSGGSPAAPVG